jgi:hypothetical protein
MFDKPRMFVQRNFTIEPKFRDKIFTRFDLNINLIFVETIFFEKLIKVLIYILYCTIAPKFREKIFTLFN